MTTESIVWDEQQQRIRADKRNIDIKTDLNENEITQDMVLDITRTYYATLNYPDFIELNKRTKIKLIGDNKRYINPYIKQPHEYIKDWNTLAENEFNRKCVQFLLRTQFYKLVERHLIPENILSDDHFEKLFNNEYTFIFTMPKRTYVIYIISFF